MVIRSVPDSISLFLDRTNRPGLTALHLWLQLKLKPHSTCFRHLAPPAGLQGLIFRSFIFNGLEVAADSVEQFCWHRQWRYTPQAGAGGRRTCLADDDDFFIIACSGIRSSRYYARCLSLASLALKGLRSRRACHALISSILLPSVSPGSSGPSGSESLL